MDKDIKYITNLTNSDECIKLMLKYLTFTISGIHTQSHNKIINSFPEVCLKLYICSSLSPSHSSVVNKYNNLGKCEKKNTRSLYLNTMC